MYDECNMMDEIVVVIEWMNEWWIYSLFSDPQGRILLQGRESARPFINSLFVRGARRKPTLHVLSVRADGANFWKA
jgi:hypothetical protein